MEIHTKKHVILGAGGAIGNVLARELLSRGEHVTLVSRSGRGLPASESKKADLNDFGAVYDAVETDSIVYLAAGLAYDRKVWQEQWPKIMENCVRACGSKKARLIFFDNVYLYGRVEGPMTEKSAINPCSRKGEIRARLVEYLTGEMKKGGVKGLIARAADFYGPYAYQSSIPYLFVFEKLLSGKKPQCLLNSDIGHSYTYTVDCGKALYLLSGAEDAYGQAWHLPTARPALSGEEFVRVAAEKLDKRPDFSIMKRWMIRMAGLFSTTVREVNEMLYQNEFDYQFDSSKFEKRFGVEPTSYDLGIEETIRHLKQRATSTSV